MASDDFTHVPPPWKLKGDIYLFSFWTPRKQAEHPPTITYSPLEANSSYINPEGSRPLGGISMVQIIRYTESPVGPYDELILSPGFHEYTVEENGKRVKKKNARITRIYVSQKQTCWNGRKNWNIPKHLAAFDWKYDVDGSTHVKVFPHDTTGDLKEASASTTPLFQGTFKPVAYVPSFPLSLNLLSYVGLDATLVQPPLPEGSGSQGELPGTDRWCSVAPGQYSKKASLGWFDIRQADEKGNIVGEHENFWPGLGRWQVGIKMENSDVTFAVPKYWDAPKSVL
ncbi:unnamed protein product [Colletotrichum noveboracense]|uniref:Acetoacetate decarboxylase n=1 Tax=Colletotrichum noveboracense TaxID=2664923 RepID=A0A9W4RKA5_9PEZI|nr:hypothetical protein COL940_011908 [Colletotrichum noveboracense]KAJ0275651.1 hypothetical protein CBS470a_011172 [Colletotrichum nupharicola]KAJ0303044.1 hypothetical protein Brms1b_011758 [Colletotrichum noveboracense]CAI0642771.1 unnamed protein product [Colletotrichum noveboracense]